MSNVLVISTNGFSKVNCNKTYESIFSSFEKHNLYSFFTRPQDLCLDYSYCESYYAVSESDIIRRFLHKSKSCGGKVESHLENIDESFVNQSQSSIYSLFKKMNSLKQNLFLKDLLWSSDLWWTKDLQAWLDSIHADVIFFHDPGIISFHYLLDRIVKYLKIPYVYYVTDDYYKYYTETWLQRRYLKQLLPVCKKTLQGASLRYCIGDMMASEYKELFGVSFDTVMNSVKSISCDSRISHSLKNASYFGGLHLDRWKMISRFADIFDGDIFVYTATALDKDMKIALNKPNIKLMGCIYGDELSQAMLKSDILLHIESDDIKFMQRTKLAVSTKIPEYLSTGNLVLGFGNPTLASMRILSDNKIGVVVDSSLNKSDAQSLLRNQLNIDSVALLKQNATAYAKKYFDESLVANRLRKAIEEVCSKKSM